MRMKMKKFLIGIITLIFVWSISINAWAESEKSGKNLFLADAYVDETVDVEGDVYATGNEVNLKGNVQGDVIAAGGKINVNVENIGGNIRVAGATINVTSKSAKNLTLAAETININENLVAGGVYLAARNIDFLGKCNDLNIGAQKVTFNGDVSGDVSIDCEELIIGSNAKVGGKIKVRASKEPTILGDFNKDNIDFKLIKSDKDIENMFKGGIILNKILSLITAIILSALITLLFKKYLEKSKGYIKDKAWLPFLIGLATLVILPIASIIICFTVVGIPIAGMALVIYGMLIYLSPIFAGIILGRVILKDMNIYLSGLIGTVIVKVLAIIPFIGIIVIFASSLLSLGVFTLNTLDRIKEN